MTPQNTLELKGSLYDFPLAELLVEIALAKLSGSLRFSREDRKNIVYFKSGKVVYAVSNARSSRLFDILLRENKIDKFGLTKIPNFTNDLELGKILVENGQFNQTDIDSLFSIQIENILREALDWNSGEWFFNPLAQIRSGINFEIDLRKLLGEYSRKLPDGSVSERFSSLQETFLVNDLPETNFDLQPHEAFVLSRFAAEPMTIDDIKILSGLPDAATYQTLYTLWLCGLLKRSNWNMAFSERHIAQIKSANLVLKQKAQVPETEPEKQPTAEIPKPSGTEQAETVIDELENEPVPEAEITLEKYLDQIENSTSYYEIFGVGRKASSAEIKQVYFKFAKQFHPDLFHNIEDYVLQQKIQGAFTKLASAYETLRDNDLRQLYDFKLRKELSKLEDVQDKKSGEKAPVTDEKAKQAAEQFDYGYDLLMEENFPEAVPFLARAVFLVPNNARYQAFFGKALAYNKDHRHKAENAIQTAIKLDPENELYRIISAEFFISHGLVKRAEGELKRLLAFAPNNHEAKVLLDSLQKT